MAGEMTGEMGETRMNESDHIVKERRGARRRRARSVNVEGEDGADMSERLGGSRLMTLARVTSSR